MRCAQVLGFGFGVLGFGCLTIPQTRRREASASTKKTLRNPDLRNLRHLRMY
jgi:hypothetical protein